jgi:tRNA(Ile)-lysidine synthase
LNRCAHPRQGLFTKPAKLLYCIVHMDLLEKFKAFIQQENLFPVKDTLLLAVSGGVDSVVLCELCQQAGYDFVIAHCNFQLRGEESNRDETLAKTLGEKYNKEVLVKRFETEEYALQNKVSIQVAARELRYSWFGELIGSRESVVDSPPLTAGALCLTAPESRVLTPDSRLPTKIATAHHLDDNIETLLMNFFKGTGIAGLRGILPKHGKIVRPLLFAKKEILQQFAMENKLSWAEDSSNQSDKYTRNYFRHQLIPLLKNLYPGAENNLSNNLQRFRDIELLYQQAIALHKKKLLEYKGSEIHIPVPKLKKAVPLVSVVYEIIKDYGFSAGQATEAIGLLDSETGKYIQSATHRIIKNRHWIIISPVNNSTAGITVIEAGTKEVLFDESILRLAPLDVRPDRIFTAHSIAESFVDSREIVFPLLLRKWKTGDYFYPLGMQKKKKLSRFFIDLKLSKADKEKIWILESNKKIIWVVGLRIDERFKITPGTKSVLHLQLDIGADRLANRR